MKYLAQNKATFNLALFYVIDSDKILNIGD